jgi:hypothetical protein
MDVAKSCDHFYILYESLISISFSFIFCKVFLYKLFDFYFIEFKLFLELINN